ncbi:MAG: Mandelate racemase/muconate lactonizing [Bacteroidetes bacterium]|nr:MAG: Mandelate racemase/muconate lactonizing [Bacteroidota bacterium]
MLRARYHKHTLHFRQAAGTSRGVLHSRDSFFLLISDAERPEITGIGECGIIPGLSFDDRPGFEAALLELCGMLNQGNFPEKEWLNYWPSMAFALSTAITDLKNGGRRLLFESKFTSGESPIAINGLVWMGDPGFMLQQIEEKISEGFSVIKMKVGAIGFEEELALIRHIRMNFPSDSIEIRIDANGAFQFVDVFKKLEKLAAYSIHSIEQPIKAGNPDLMAEICRNSPIPVALDEELIGVFSNDAKKRLLDKILPQYIILKPSLLGGFENSQQWIKLAEERGAGWWVTSALESNIGLNAIAQWTATLNNPLPQGLGTGSLYSNNIPSPLQVENGFLHYKPETPWQLKFAGLNQD